MIQNLIDRLTQANTGYTTVDFAPDLNPQQNLRSTMPLALFLTGPSKSEPSETLPLRQRQSKSVMVLTVCKHHDLDARLDELHAALLGYQHSENYTPLSHSDGELIDVEGEIVRWADMFVTDHWINGTQ